MEDTNSRHAVVLNEEMKPGVEIWPVRDGAMLIGADSVRNGSLLSSVKQSKHSPIQYGNSSRLDLQRLLLNSM